MWLTEARNRVDKQYLSKAGNCCSIVPRGIEKAGKKFSTSYTLFVAICMTATLFQLVADTVLRVATIRQLFYLEDS